MTVCDHSVNRGQQKSWEGVWLWWEMGRGGGIRFRLSDCTTAPVQPGTEDCPLLVTCRCPSVQKYTETDRSDMCPPLHSGPPQNRECSGKKAQTNGRKMWKHELAVLKASTVGGEQHVPGHLAFQEGILSHVTYSSRAAVKI